MPRLLDRKLADNARAVCTSITALSPRSFAGDKPKENFLKLLTAALDLEKLIIKGDIDDAGVKASLTNFNTFIKDKLYLPQIAHVIISLESALDAEATVFTTTAEVSA